MREISVPHINADMGYLAVAVLIEKDQIAKHKAHLSHGPTRAVLIPTDAGDEKTLFFIDCLCEAGTIRSPARIPAPFVRCPQKAVDALPHQGHVDIGAIALPVQLGLGLLDIRIAPFGLYMHLILFGIGNGFAVGVVSQEWQPCLRRRTRPENADRRGVLSARLHGLHQRAGHGRGEYPTRLRCGLRDHRAGPRAGRSVVWDDAFSLGRDILDLSGEWQGYY